jgi:hypothetical protein
MRKERKIHKKTGFENLKNTIFHFSFQLKKGEKILLADVGPPPQKEVLKTILEMQFHRQHFCSFLRRGHVFHGTVRCT